MKRTYLDHAATTQPLASVIDEVTEHLKYSGNASALHSAGRRARAVVEQARERIAQAVGCDSAEVIFTAGGTEADNLAIKGIYRKRTHINPQCRRILISSIEHHAVSESAEWLEAHEQAQLCWIPVDSHGLIDMKALKALIEEDPENTALITVMWANNEVGTIQPIRKIAELSATYNIPFHTDAVQAFGAIPINFRQIGANSMAISGHKMGAPQGIGALIATRTTALAPVLHGGGQERAVRSGTLDTASIAGFGVAAQEVTQHLAEEMVRLGTLRNTLIERIRHEIPNATLRGAEPESIEELEQEGATRRLPHNVHFTFDGCEGDSLLFLLDMAGIESSTGSACNAGVPRPSHVLLAMGVDEEHARGAQRFTLGHTSTSEDIEALMEALPGAYEQAHKAGLAAHVPNEHIWH
ncbi:cysteine desulfurase family protein [Rothia sp. P7181]|uniref:cysteine desulfurase family protein n=1 Tax=Rothia sp. P7181 TaxID=3402663 RepID=UPI003AE0E5C7